MIDRGFELPYLVLREAGWWPLFTSGYELRDLKGRPQLYVNAKTLSSSGLSVFGDRSKKEEHLEFRWSERGHEVVAAGIGEVIAVCKVHGFTTLVGRTEWSILDPGGEPRGSFTEVGFLRMLLSRYFPWVPRQFELTWDGSVVARVRQRLHPLRTIHDIAFLPDTGFDHRIGVAAVLLAVKYDGDTVGQALEGMSDALAA